MDAAKRYSLWLMPPPDVAQAISEVIERLSIAYATSRFAPHLTLLGGITGSEAALRDVAAALTARLEPLPARPLGIGRTDEYYRCLFIEVALNDALLDAHVLAQRFFETYDDRPFMPHISLLYGQLEPDEKERLIPSIELDLPAHFLFERMELFRTGSPPEEWMPLEKFRLGQSQ